MQRFEHKYDLLKAAYRDRTLKKGTIALLQYLVHKSDKEKCFPAVDTIAKALGVCRRTVQYNMRRLEKAGYIIRKDRWYNHQQLSNQYVFCLGVLDETPETCIYPDAEKKKAARSFSNVQDNRVQLGNKEHKGGISKAVEIGKIYSMPLSGREKLLLIYLYHRANQQGTVYGTADVFATDIGVSARILIRLLGRLREKKLLKIKKTRFSGKAAILIHLTGNTWNEAEASMQMVRRTVFRGQQTEQKNIQIMENTSKTNRFLTWIGNIWKVKIKEKIRSILRI